MKKIMNSSIEEMSEDLIEGLEPEEIKDKNVTVFISDRDKIKVKDEFVLLFASNLQTLLVKDKISLRELKILLTIVKFSQFKNVFNVTQRVIAENAGLDKASVSRDMKKLKSKGFILHDKITGVDFVNPYLFLKGSVKEFKASPIAKQLHFFEMDEDISNPFWEFTFFVMDVP